MPELNQQIGQIIDEQREILANTVIKKDYADRPELMERYGEKGKKHYLQDTVYHLTYLAEAIASEHPSIFASYVAWAKVLLSNVNIPIEEFVLNLQLIKGALKQILPENMQSIACQYIDEGLQQLPNLPTGLSSFIETTEPHAELAQQYLDTLLKADRKTASHLILDAVEKGIPIKDIYIHVFQRSQYEIGRLWQMNKVSVAQEHYCTAATQLIMSQLYSHIFSTTRKNHTVVATCVGGDLHEIGIRMVSDFFEMEGWDTYYLGANTPTPSVLQELETRHAEILAISATMTFHIRAVEQLIATVHSSNTLQHIKIIVGGYPFNIEPELWKHVGAHAYASNAQDAITVAETLIN